MSVHSKQVEITSPCPITLDRSEVTPEDRAMHCAHCVKDVHILSNMTEREARDFLAGNEGADVCVSYKIKSNGKIRFRPEPALVPVASLARHRRRSAATQPKRVGKRPSRVAAMATTLGTAILLAACAPHSNTDAIQHEGSEIAATHEQVVIPVKNSDEVPCDPNDDIQVDGGIKAVPIDEPPRPDIAVAGGIRPMPIPEEVVPEPVPVPIADPDERQVRGRMALPPTPPEPSPQGQPNDAGRRIGG